MAEEAKARIAETFKEAYLQYTEGCGRSVCFNRDCAQCPFREKMANNEAALFILNRFRVKGDAAMRFSWCEKLPSCSTIDEAKDLQITFSRLDVLGGIYVSGALTDSDPAIDYREVEETYRKAQELVQRRYLSETWLLECLSSITPTQFALMFLPRALLILLEIPDLIQPEMTDTLVQVIQLAEEYLDPMREQLVKWLQPYTGAHLLKFIYPLQQFITLKICDDKNNSTDEDVIAAVRLLDVLNEANRSSEQVSYKEFYNDAVNKEADMQQHFVNWLDYRDEQAVYSPDRFSLMYFPWILDSASKSELLRYESIITQRISQRQIIREMIELGINQYMPYLILEVRRDNLIEDTINLLVHREESLRKPLKIHFINEEGIDGGGVQKEFFQLIVRELFDPQFSMFTYYEDTRYYWFNPDSMASDDEYELVGMILGLAIYNSNIIDVHLPLAVYKKLVGARTSIEDLATFNPTLARSMKEILKMEGDVESILCRTFDVETMPYGEPVHHELKPNGAQIPVTNENRQEYVDLYVDWVLNASAGSHFEAFQTGFLKVCGGEVMKMFRAEELELLVCGNPVLDFYALENACIYEDGYTRESQSCQMLWKVLHSLTEEQKKKFLFFVTGSDRAPINGLGSMRFVISRNGPDSDRLMTAHTCFNHLLLPEYKSEKKIRDMLLLAINNSEGFGLR